MKLARYKKSFIKLYLRILNYAFGGKRILVLGDSHGGIFERCFDAGMMFPHFLNCEIVGGATAYGLNNEKSTTGAWKKFKHSLKRYKNFNVIVIVLGECDCSFSLWKSAERKNVSAESLIGNSMSGIRKLLNQIKKSSHENDKIIIVGSILPTIQDSYASIQENTMRREITNSHQERTNLVFLFNENLKQLALEYKVHYFDVTKETINVETGFIDIKFIENPCDHHLYHAPSMPFFSSKLRSFL